MKAAMRPSVGIVAALLGVCLAAAPAGADVVVEEVTPEFAAAKAGLAPGDVIVAWSRPANPPSQPEGASGRIDTPFDLLDVEVEQSPHGRVTLTGWRDDTERQWVLATYGWRLLVRPAFRPRVLDLYEKGERLLTASGAAAIAAWNEAARVASGETDGTLQEAWILARGAQLLGSRIDQQHSDELYSRTVVLLDDLGSPIAAAQVLRVWAEDLLARERADLAKARFEDALDRYRRSRGDSMALARSLRDLARAEVDLGATDRAEALQHQALGLYERLAPDSVPMGDCLSTLGKFELARKELAGAEEHLARALRIHEPASGLAYAMDLSALAGLAALRGDYVTASEQLRAALPTLERVAPASHQLAYALYTAGMVNSFTGSLEEAEAYARKALQIYRQLPASEAWAGHTLQLLSGVSWDRQDYALAQSQGREAVAILEATAPGSVQLGTALHRLGDIALAQADLLVAEKYFHRALDIDEGESPQNLIAANDLRCLGLTLARSGRVDEGRRYVARSAEIRKRLVPSSHELSKSLMALGEIARLQGDLADAERHYREAVSIRRKVVPGTREEAEAHHGLGRVHLEAGRLTLAAEAFEEAVSALEQQRGSLGGTAEARGSFSAAYAHYYQDAIETLIDLGRASDAFHVVERSRVRSLLAMLAERQLTFPADLPPELATERRLNHARYDRAQAELAALSPDKHAAEIERLLGRLRELRAEGADIAARIRAVSPLLASLQYPEPLDARQAATILDADAVLLSFAVGEESTLLFAIRGVRVGMEAGSLSVITLPLGRKQLRQRIESFRRLISHASLDQDVLRSRAAELYDLLLRPVDDVLRASQRVAISPDGPLHLLPFGSLARRDVGGSGATTLWLAEWKPTFVVASATQYAVLKKRRSAAAASGRLVAFGDPVHLQADSVMSSKAADREGVRSPGLAPLPHSRQEVQRITALFGSQALAYLGVEATESRAKQAMRGASYVHFATHAVLDEVLPLNSALVLSGTDVVEAGHENGLLQVWEIFEAVRLEAELATLSGCETALGEEMGGEGLMSLTQAFQYAGARSVLASHWRVPDESTAELMVGFYEYLKAGHSKADALRLVQIEFIRSRTKAAHPFRWAAFSVFGDWR